METTQVVNMLLNEYFQGQGRPQELEKHLKVLIGSLREPLRGEYARLAHELELAEGDPEKLTAAAGKLREFLQNYESRTVLMP